MQRLKLHNDERNTQQLHSLMCSVHNIGMNKGHLEKERVRGSFVIRIYSCKKIEVWGSSPDNWYVLPNRLNTSILLLFIFQTHSYKFTVDNSWQHLS